MTARPTDLWNASNAELDEHGNIKRWPNALGVEALDLVQEQPECRPFCMPKYMPSVPLRLAFDPAAGPDSTAVIHIETEPEPPPPQFANFRLGELRISDHCASVEEIEVMSKLMMSGKTAHLTDAQFFAAVEVLYLEHRYDRWVDKLDEHLREPRDG